jgi:hypothetical protein
MHRLSVVQALALWSLLDDAYYGHSHFGGDVAEIYVYTLMAHSTLVSECMRRSDPIPYLRKLAEEDVHEANETFLHLLAHFSKERNAIVEIKRWDGESAQFSEIGPWVATLGESHRFHVRVRPREEPHARPSEP